MERQLVSIRTVSEVCPIPDADAIEAAAVDGWKCVVKKGDFQVGDQAVYFEIDSLLPLSDERFAFLKKGAVGQEFHRLRTIKLRKQLSQGLLMPTSLFPELLSSASIDLAAVLGITKYEPILSATLAGKAKGFFPSFIRKTDEERIQNMPSLVTEQADKLFEVSTKLDGSSMTAFYNEGKFGICSRNLELIESYDNTFWKVANTLQLPEAMQKLGRNLAIQGELMGPGIQGNKEKLKDHDFFVFNVFDIDNQEYLSFYDRLEVMECLKQAGAGCLRHVPGSSPVQLNQAGSTLQDLLKYAEGTSLNAPSREGLVFKRIDGKVSFKVISNAYLLAEK